MNGNFQAGGFSIEYKESRNDAPVVWENHCHTQYEMISVLEGDITVMLEGRSYRLKADYAVIIPPLLYHTITANQRGIYRRITALFDIDAIPTVLHPHFQQKDADLNIFLSRENAALRQLFQLTDPHFYAPLGESIMIRLLYDEIRAEHVEAEAVNDEFLQKIIAYIDKHLSEHILLDDLAVLTSRSRSSVSHLFEEKMNITPKQYILQKKMALAHKLINDGMSPTTAAMQIGYENYSNFYRIYRKMFLTSPSGKG